jgi:hypothetical protein
MISEHILDLATIYGIMKKYAKNMEKFWIFAPSAITSEPTIEIDENHHSISRKRLQI